MMRARALVQRVYHWQGFSRCFPILLFVFAFLVRLGLVLAMKTYSSPYHFSEHVRIADNVLSGRGYSFPWYGLGAGGQGSFMPPAYVAVVLMARVAFPSTPWLAIQIFQAALSAGTAVIIYFVGREVFTELVGTIASSLVAVYPPSLGYVLDVQTVVWETFWVVLAVLACNYWGKSGTWKRAVLVGFVWGVMVLSRSNLILLMPVLLIWMVLSHGRQGAVQFAVVVCAFALVVGPWVFRNLLVHKEFVFVSTEGGITLFQGNNAYATGASYPALGDLWKQHPELAEELAPLGEAARDRRLYQESIAFIRTHPQDTLLLALRKLVYFWWFKPSFIEGAIVSGYPWFFGLIYMCSYAILLSLSILGVLFSLREYRKILIIYALFLIQTLVSMIFVAGTRFRVILEPLLILFAAYGIALAFSKFLVPYQSNPGTENKNFKHKLEQAQAQE